MTRRDLLRTLLGAVAGAAVAPNIIPAVTRQMGVKLGVKLPTPMFHHQWFSQLFSTEDLIAQRTLFLDLPPSFIKLQLGEHPFLNMPVSMFGVRSAVTRS